jgi:hypothetical protein
MHTSNAAVIIASHGQIGDGKLGPFIHVCRLGPGVPEHYIGWRETEKNRYCVLRETRRRAGVARTHDQ